MTISFRIACSVLLATTCLIPLRAAKVKTQGGKELAKYKSFQWLPPRVLSKVGLQEDHVANPILMEVVG